MNLQDLPEIVLDYIFDYLSYDEISQIRVVNKFINETCKRILNKGFSRMIKRHGSNLKRIKSLLPRRESERRIHPLARHADVLTCIETRISMLSMTYTKYIDLNLCCFIPGKVIDEVFKILRIIETTSKPLRAHEVLQELRDISSMAIEHFDEKIAPLMKKKFLEINSQRYPFGGVESSSDESTAAILITQPTKSYVAPIPSKNEEFCRCPEARSNRMMLYRTEQKCKATIRKVNRVILSQIKQMRHMRQYAVIINEMNSQIIELKRRVDETDAKNREISANISQLTGEPGTTPKTPERPLRNIKPRAATVILKRRLEAPSSLTSGNVEPLAKKPTPE